MATMYSLLFGFFLAALWAVVGTGHGIIRNTIPCSTGRWFVQSHSPTEKYAGGAAIDQLLLPDRPFPLGSTKKKLFIKNRGISRSTYLMETGETRNKEIVDIRLRIIGIAAAEIGVQELTGNNDGPRVEEYLHYTDLGKGYAWCAAFVSWCYGRAGLPEPRNPWSPALFPKTKTYCKDGRCRAIDMEKEIRTADIFGIYGVSAKRINHVGLVRKSKSRYILTIEGNSNNRVESRQRHISTLYALSDWVSH